MSSLANLKSITHKNITKRLMNKFSTKALNIDDISSLKNNQNKLDNKNIFLKKKKKKKKRMTMKDIYSLINFINDEEVDKKN